MSDFIGKVVGCLVVIVLVAVFIAACFAVICGCLGIIRWGLGWW